MRYPYSDEDRILFRAIAARVREYRQQEELTQENIARKLGILPSAYSRLEQGKGALTTAQLVKISQYLQIPIARFFP
jgi:transcriptional regulator with XRE-family HTH domain